MLAQNRSCESIIVRSQWFAAITYSWRKMAKKWGAKNRLVGDLLLTKLKINPIFVLYIKEFISSHIESFEIPAKLF